MEPLRHLGHPKSLLRPTIVGAVRRCNTGVIVLYDRWTLVAFIVIVGKWCTRICTCLENINGISYRNSGILLRSHLFIRFGQLFIEELPWYYFLFPFTDAKKNLYQTILCRDSKLSLEKLSPLSIIGLKLNVSMKVSFQRGLTQSPCFAFNGQLGNRR